MPRSPQTLADAVRDQGRPARYETGPGTATTDFEGALSTAVDRIDGNLDAFYVEGPVRATRTWSPYW